MKLVREYLRISKNDPPWPPINNASALLQGSGWNTRRYFRGVYRRYPPNPGLIIMRGSEGSVHLGSRAVASTASEVFRRYLRNPASLRVHNRHLRPLASRTRALYARSTYRWIEQLPERALLRTVTDALWATWRYNAYAWYSLAFDKDACLEDLRAADAGISSRDVEIVWERGTQPSTPSFDRMQRRIVLQLLSRGVGWDAIAQRCQFFGASYYDVSSITKVRERLRREYAAQSTPRVAVATLLRDDTEALRIERRHHRWRSTLAPRQRRFVDYLQTVIAVRDSRKNVFAQGLTVYWRVAERLFREAGIDGDFLPFCTRQELGRGSAYLHSLRSEFPKRRRGFAVLIRPDGTVSTERGSYLSWKRALDAAFTASEQQLEPSGVLRGHVGSPGRAQGRVRIVLNLRAVGKFAKGDILVAGMTRPEYVTLMRRAGAIITDEGGITSHAAIVSRELGIPCVIGTKVATRVLKDGDWVEVDANKGIVRKV